MPFRAAFPFFSTLSPDKPLAYLDSAASAQKLGSVLTREQEFYTREYSNIHRGVYALSERATAAFEQVRADIAAYMGVQTDEIVFTRSSTEGLNLLANTISFAEGDVILVSGMEHHANLVPWYMAAQRSGAELRDIPLRDDGTLDEEAYLALLSPRVRLVALTHVSNVLGTINPVRRFADAAHRAGALVVVDGSQAIPHMPVSMGALGADAYVWTGHKAFGPTGTGVLWMRASLMDQLPPWQGGGDMIETVSFDRITYRTGPARFEAGTPNIAGVIALGEAVRFLAQLDWEAVHQHETMLANHARRMLTAIPGLRLLGEAAERAPVFSFALPGIHPHDLGTILDAEGVCVRTGQHCAEPLLRHYGLAATTRLSCALYTQVEELDQAGAALQKALHLFA